MTVGLARKLSRTKPHREALMRNMVSQLLQYGSIMSTKAKCQEASRVAERVITWAKKVHQNPQSPLKSQIQSRLYLSGDNSKLMKRLVYEIAPLYASRDGGYTRVMHLEPRLTDKAPQSLLELVNTPIMDAKGNFNRGNMKFWLLVKNTLADENAGRPYTILTLQNLRKIGLGKSREQLEEEIAAVRKFLIEEEDLQWDEPEQMGQVKTLLNQVYGTDLKKLREEDRARRGGYQFVERPQRT
ncbi:ZYBA0S03-05842g1_1 [Zygosaccharomyces bailii CLIB 213]|uniref:ZYBA0S03-05842g1_1 n=1 Tax=Zygosaccharomyces bailii (strain CLIB 213 / ATCC 58445 / CBS 680 / BCRC 21525 / NBRC 1098 / NCYC 1416 / NRRL Y-2227) TaxID=1333698 RepID=A0A8J2T826_ZYGB2|nr:ZYBA0S03-05842g1_1 [Zygosaccharomyces bailii CLIB 213]